MKMTAFFFARHLAAVGVDAEPALELSTYRMINGSDYHPLARALYGWLSNYTPWLIAPRGEFDPTLHAVVDQRCSF